MKTLLRIFLLLAMLSYTAARPSAAQEAESLGLAESPGLAESLGASIDLKIKAEKNLERPFNTTLIVAAGALPFAVFYTDFAFDLYRFIEKGFDVQYAPWPLKNQYSATLSTGEKFIRVGVAVGVAATIGLLSITIPYH